jgi:CubicO group peptidase (beta-lactamase class C family)
MIRQAIAAVALSIAPAVGAQEPEGLHEALTELATTGRFSGAVVVRDANGIRFARGYGPADPFTGRAFTAETPADSGSLAKPVTAAAVLLLARDGRIDLDAPVRLYLPEYPHAKATVRHLLAHSAGLRMNETPEGLAGKTNAALLAEAGDEPLFPPGGAFDYCNLCYSALALLIERVTGRHYLAFVRDSVALPKSVPLRPMRLSDWTGRAIGYRRSADGRIERFDSWEGELLYGPANFSVSARQLADWGAEWWKQPLSTVREQATAAAIIAGKSSGLSWGSWYCSDDRRRCSYPGHHEGFHHNLYWDSQRRLSVALLTNNTLAPGLQQRLQRALVAFAEGRPRDARRELASPQPDVPTAAGDYALPTGEQIRLSGDGRKAEIERRGVRYAAYRVGEGIRYVPGLDLYVAGTGDGRLHWLSLYEDMVATPLQPGRGR